MIAVNTTFAKALWADALYACDEAWWDHYFVTLATTFRGQLWTVSGAARDRWGCRWILGVEGGGVSRVSTHIHTGMNSGYQAIGLAHNFGARRIILLGFDFCRGPRNETHHHGDHPKNLGTTPQSRFPGWIRAMDQLASDLRKRGVAVVNCSRRTALKCFQRAELAEALCN